MSPRPNLPRDGTAPIPIDLTDVDACRAQIVLAHLVGQTIRAMPLEELINGIRQAHAVVPITHPSLYIEKGKAMQEDEQVLEILRSAQKQLQKLHDRIVRQDPLSRLTKRELDDVIEGWSDDDSNEAESDRH